MKRLAGLVIVLLCFWFAINVSGSEISEDTSGYLISQVKDIYPGASGSTPEDLIVYNNKLYFQARDSTYGVELLEYDGIRAPKLVADIRPGISSSHPRDFAVFNGKLYFCAVTDPTGYELFVYDGVNPPSMVHNINPGSSNSYPDNLTVFDGVLYFRANDGVTGKELWAYDGVNPPSRVADINPGSAWADPNFLTVFNNKLYFNATTPTFGAELWEYNGSNPPINTADIKSGTGSSSPNYLVVFKDKLYFSASHSVSGTELWVYTGSGSPTLVDDINPGTQSSAPYYLTAVEYSRLSGKLYFSAKTSAYGRELWEYTGSGTPSLVADIFSGTTDSNPGSLTWFSGRLLFNAVSPIYGYELWEYDGVNPPFVVDDIYPGVPSSLPWDLQVYKDKLYFKATDGFHGDELWEYGPPTVKDMFYSQATYDGWVLETGENTSAGGLINTTNLTCNIGDDALNRQYRTLLHFNTSRIPDNAHITKASLQYKRHSLIGDRVMGSHGNIWADIKEGFYSNNAALVQSDFAAAPSMGFAGYFVWVPSSLAYPIYRVNLKDTALEYFNLNGITQFRLRFGLDDDNDNTADYIKIFCGDMPVPFNRPVLRVWYYAP